MSDQKYPYTPRLIVIVGPTGSGKSSLSIEIAQHLNAPIISTDSRQFYRGIPIGTAQPTSTELASAEHHFIACRELTDDYNCGEYEKDALELLTSLFREHPYVIAVGGSGLYIKALCEGLDALPDVPQSIRDDIRQLYVSEGIAPLLSELERLDPDHYAKVDRSNSARVMRALELCRASGRAYSEMRSGESKSRDFEIIKIGLDLPREELYTRINLRVEDMIANGLEAEARRVYPLRSLNSLQTVGYREIFDYIDGELSFDAAIELIKRNSRRYAKRQMTWFRRDSAIKWFTDTSSEPIINWLESKK